MNWKQIKVLVEQPTGWCLYDTEIEGCYMLTDQRSALLIYTELPTELEKHIITNEKWSKSTNSILNLDYHELATVHLSSLQQALGGPVWFHTKENCPDCYGVGFVKCDDCSGTGFVDCDCECPYCNNEVDCLECDGRGRLECFHQANLDYDSLIMVRSQIGIGEYFSKLRVAQTLDLVVGSDWYAKISLSTKKPSMLIEGELWKLVIRNMNVSSVPEIVPVVELTENKDSLYGFTKGELKNE